MRAASLCAAAVAAGGAAWVLARPLWTATVEARPNLEERAADGAPWSPATQSFLRGRHGLERVRRVSLRAAPDLTGEARLGDATGRELLRVVGLPLATLVPRLRYATSAFDDFDAFNLMMQEFSRNGQSVPWGRPGDALAHFESDAFDSETPYTLRGDYDFVPNPACRPLRLALVNNCLEAGLWEVAAQDRVGELWHAWLQMPPARYLDLVARANGLERAFVQRALAWSTQPVALALERLRAPLGEPEQVALALTGLDEAAGYSTQDSRQKLGKGFVEVERPSGLARPTTLRELTEHRASLVAFVPPGLYSRAQRRVFDFSWLRGARSAQVLRVRPLTRYEPRDAQHVDRLDATHVELRIAFDGGRSLLVGNLPLPLVAQQEDYALYGFGVGVLPPESPAERTRLLMRRGPVPPYAYVTEQRDGTERALNSHALGLEQVFVRAHPFATPPHWEIVLSSYERIADLVRWRVNVPPALQDEVREASRAYVSPAYFSYRDDNTR